MANWKEALIPDPYIRMSLKALHRRITLGETPLVIASTQIERAVAYNLPVPQWISKKYPSKPRQRWDRDYSLGGPLWLEWQRLQTHSEWDGWRSLYRSNAPKIRWQVYYDWLLENDFPLEAEEIYRCIIEVGFDWIGEPDFHSIEKGSDPEPVEGAA